MGSEAGYKQGGAGGGWVVCRVHESVGDESRQGSVASGRPTLLL